MNDFTHLLITKFNTRSFPTGSKGCDPEWLDYRFKLFDQFCYPSVKSQSSQNFRWLVLFDSQTPDEFKKRVDAYAADFKNFTPLYLDFLLPYGTFPEDLRKLVSQYIDSSYLITTWLDNDDAISKNYIQMIQDNFDFQENEVINFVAGYQLYQGKLYLDYEVITHFVSLVERYDEKSFGTVLAKDHNFLLRICGSTRNILCEPSWMEVLHGSNVTNVYRKGLRVKLQSGLKNFVIEPDGNFFSTDKNFLSFVADRIKTSISLCYSIVRKLYIITIDPHFRTVNYFRAFRLQASPSASQERA